MVAIIVALVAVLGYADAVHDDCRAWPEVWRDRSLIAPHCRVYRELPLDVRQRGPYVPPASHFGVPWSEIRTPVVDGLHGAAGGVR